MSLIVVPYEPVHAMLIPEVMNQPRFRHHPEYRDWARGHQYSQEAVTILLEDTKTVVACCGVERLWEDVGDLWLLLSVEAAPVKKTVSIMSKQVFDKWFADYRRLQATVDAESRTSRRFVEYLGMEVEGRLRRFGPYDRDYLMYAKVK